MGRKKNNPGIYLYPHDILSSPRCRSLTPGGAGIYFFLFLRLCDPPMPGAYRLRDWEPHPKWQKSDTRKCLAIADKRERLPLFAKWLAKNDLPWTKSEVLPYLQELYDRGIVIIEGDMLIQPRLYVDNGFEIPDLDGDGDPVGSILDDPVSGQMQAFDNTLQGGLNIKKNKGVENGTEKCTEKGTKKGTKNSRVGGRIAGVRSKRVGVGDNNNDNSIGSIGGVGEQEPKGNPKQSGKGKTDAAPQTECDTGADATGRQKLEPVPVADNPPTLDDVKAYMQESGELGRIFRFITAEEYYDEGCKNGWRQRGGQPLYDWKAQLRSYEAYRRNHGDVPVSERGKTQPKAARQGGLKQGVQVTEVKPGQYDEEW